MKGLGILKSDWRIWGGGIIGMMEPVGLSGGRELESDDPP
jgi:hypothetical protein